ncbi:MAG: tetratricopeptide repeat protein [Rubrivivax sp.]
MTHRARLTLTAVLIEAGLVFDAQRTLDDATRRQASLPTRSEVRLDAADLRVSLRIAQDRFDDAERLAQEMMKLTGDLPSGQASARHLRARLRWHAALAALGRWEDARAAIAETVRVVAASPSLRAAAEEDALVRGWVLLQLGEARAALDVLEPARARALEAFGPSSPGTALLTGLSAWALWEQGARPEALARFDEAMPRLMASDGLVAGLFERGIRNALRRAIAAAYLRSMATSGDRARQIGALAVADALVGASVQQALSEAALRTRVDPALQSLVRREQDLRHRVEAVHQALNRPSDGDEQPVDAELRRTLAAQLRSLHDEYLAARDALQQALPRDIRADGSAAAQPRAIAAQLAAGEAFVLIWPADSATYVWFVPAAGEARFHVVSASAAEIASLVQRVRASTVFPAAGPLPPFDVAAATRLRALLLEPLRPALDEVRHLVVAAGGSLGRLPFALLPAEQEPGAPPATPAVPNAWLVNQMAVSQWPSARAWQALEPLRRSPRARSPFLGWGDPAFAGDASAASAAGRSLDLRRSASAAIDYHAIPPLPTRATSSPAIRRNLARRPSARPCWGRATRSSVVTASRSGELAERRASSSRRTA